MASKRSKTPEGANGSARSTDDLALAIATGSGDSAGSRGSAGARGSAASGGSSRSAGKGGRPNLRSLTLTALLGVFILAVIVAVLRHFLPGRFSGIVGRAMERAEGDEGDEE
jgi:hypothetical protein